MSTLSRGSTPIGPTYNDTNREARKLKRRGFGRAAEEMAMEATKQKLAGGGSNITSSESNRGERRGLETTQRGLMRQTRDSILKSEADPTLPAADTVEELTTAATGDTLAKRQGLYERMRGGITPAMRTEAAGLGITDSGFAKASASAAKNPPTTPPAAAGVTPPAAAARPATFSGVPVLGGVLDAARDTPAPPREGRINGMPASQAIAEAGRPQGPQFGADIAKGNLASGGLSAAIADYKRRSEMPTAAASELDQEPGNMAGLKRRDATGVPILGGILGNNVPNNTGGRLQGYLDGWKAEKQAVASKPPTAPVVTASSPAPGLGGPAPEEGDFRSRYTPEERQKAREDSTPDPATTPPSFARRLGRATRGIVTEALSSREQIAARRKKAAEDKIASDKRKAEFNAKVGRFGQRVNQGLRRKASEFSSGISGQ